MPMCLSVGVLINESIRHRHFTLDTHASKQIVLSFWYFYNYFATSSKVEVPLTLHIDQDPHGPAPEPGLPVQPPGLPGGVQGRPGGGVLRGHPGAGHDCQHDEGDGHGQVMVYLCFVSI